MEYSIEGHGKLWKSNAFGQKDILKIEEITDGSDTGFNFSTNRHKHTFYAL